MRTIVSDIEADGLLPTVSMMSVAWTYCIEEDEWKEWREHEVEDYVAYLNTASLLVFHNGIGYDRLALLKIQTSDLTPPIYDTLVVSRLRDPDRRGGHSLRVWGIRLGILKGTVGEEDEDIEEVYGVYTSELSEYCKQDVAVTLALFNLMNDKWPASEVDWNPIKFEEWEV